MFKALESMMPEDQMPPAMDDDEDMPDEGLFESCMDLHEDHPEMAEMHEMACTMDDLEHLHDVVHEHGVSKMMMAFANKDGVLSAAMPAFAACEALDGDAPAGSPEAETAKSSIVDKIKEVAAAWFKKTWDVVSGWGSKIGAFAHAAYMKVEMAAKWFAGKTFNAAKAAADHITAHPVAYITAAAASAATITGVIVGLWTGTLPTDSETYKKWASEAQAKVSEEMKKLGDMASMGAHIAGDAASDAAHAVGGAVKTGTAAALGYTKEGFDHLLTAVKGLYGEDGPITKLAGFFKTGIEHVLEAVKTHGGEAWKWTRKAVAWLLQQTWHLWSRAPATTLKYFTKALKIFKGFFEGGGKMSYHDMMAAKNAA